MGNHSPSNYSLKKIDGRYVARFAAMASPCEILLDHTDLKLAHTQVKVAVQEVLRIEQKFSRYRTDNIIHTLNHANGQAVRVDEETAHLINFSATLYKLSDGAFDITSGVLRRVWKFDGSDRIPDPQAISSLLPLIGWQHVYWKNPYLQLRPGMEIDFGGIGKEYAVDRVFLQLAEMDEHALLVNFGGDLRARGPCRNGLPWQVGIESPLAQKSATHNISTAPQAIQTIPLITGALATSGDARRFLLKDGVRYSHILNPKTGWPVQNGPRSATILAKDCVLAGMLATLTLLAGKQAEMFLNEQEDIKAWLVW
ncbi:MAG: FAD:protein FMN transferase [Candidatus Nitrotoga sp.]